MTQVLVIKNKGLQTSPNEFSGVQSGAMLRATNCSIDVDDVLEPRRGFSRFVDFSSNTDRARRYAFFQSQKIAAYSNGKVAYYNGSSWTDFSGTYSDSDSSYAHLRFLKVGSNLYWTSSGGVYRLDTYNGTPILSGIPKGLDLNLTAVGGGSIVSNNNQIAYRQVWGFKDANGTVFLGAPSGRSTLINSSGGTVNVTVRFTVPSSITTSYFFQVYRSAQSGAVGTEPSDEMGLIYEANPSPTDITNGYVEFTDSTPDSLRGATLYTSPSQEGVLQGNERPPLSDDIATFGGCMFYFNCKSKHRRYLTLVSASTLAVNDTITIAGTTYTAKGAETIGSGEYQRYTAGSAAQNIADTASSLVRVINRYTSNTLVYAYYISGVNDLPGQILIEERGIGGSAFSINVSANAIAWNPVLPIKKTFVDGNVTTGTDTINISTHGFITGQVGQLTTTGVLPTGLSLSTDYYVIRVDANNIKLASSLVNANASTAVDITAAAGGGTHTFTPTNVASSADDFQHQIMFSKPDKHEAVPLVNTRFAGSQNNPIRRGLALGNSLFIYKEQEGIYRITGEYPNFTVELFDSSARILAPDSLAVVNNQQWALTDQGITIISETGTSVVSRPIEDLILEQTGTALTQVKTYTHGVAYESDRKYIVWTVSSSGDTYATQAYIWNTFTKAWTKWDIAATTAEVSPDDGKLYIGSGDSKYTLQERKSLDYTDFADYTISVTISSFSGTSITLASSSGLSVGDRLVQGTINSTITEIAGSGGIVVVADTFSGWSAGSATVYKSYECQAEWAPVTGANPGSAKQFPEISLLFKSARFNEATVSFATDASASFDSVDINGNRSGLWGLFPWGGSAWGSSSSSVPIRTYVPLEKQRGSLIRVRFTIREAYAPWKLNGFSLPFRDCSSTWIAK